MMPRVGPEPSDMDLGAALAELDEANPKATAIVRAYLAKFKQDDPLDRLLAVAVDPVWRAAIEAVGAFNAIKQREVTVAERDVEARVALAKVYAERTALWKDVILPKVMPAVGILLAVLVAWIAMMLGVSTEPAGLLTP